VVMEENLQGNQSPSATTATAAAPPPEQPKGKPKSFTCPACGGTITLKAVGITINAVCSYCSSVIDVTNENYRIIEQANRNTRKTLIEIGCRGKLEGIEWEVVGYMEKTDASGDYPWDEYLLYNPYYGFRFLVQESGHWNFVKVLRKDVAGAGISNKIKLEGKKFALFLRGDAIVNYVKGEFYWRVRKGEQTVVADYIAPPRILSVEKNDEEISISLGEYIEPEEIASAFAIKEQMPEKIGVASNQPARNQNQFGNILFIAAAAFALVCGVQYATASMADNADVYTSQFVVRPEQKDQTITTPAFSIPKDGNVMIACSSPVDNDWVELDMSLVNEKTDTSYELKQAIEYYHGYDDGESWSEGSQSSSDYISRVPAGNYRLMMDMDAGALSRNMPVVVSLSVKRDVPSWSNFWIAMLSIIVFPTYMLVRRWNFEKTRWSESDYTPAIYRISESSGKD
jgi:hypothetical protein